jgi:hypothetical protein
MTVNITSDDERVSSENRLGFHKMNRERNKLTLPRQSSPKHSPKVLKDVTSSKQPMATATVFAKKRGSTNKMFQYRCCTPMEVTKSATGETQIRQCEHKHLSIQDLANNHIPSTTAHGISV